MKHWSERSWSNLEGVHPDLRAVMDRALQASPIDFIVIEGLRTKARQRDLIQRGASRTMNSRHLTGHAVDLLPIDPKDGRGKFAWPLYHPLAEAVKAAALELGVSITWGGDWSTFKDGPHFELSWHDYPKGEPWPTKPKTTPTTPRSLWSIIAGWIARIFNRHNRR